MKLDMWKSAFDGRWLISVPAGVEPWTMVDRSAVPWYMRDVRLFRRGLEATRTPLVRDADAVLAQIREQGFALHVGSAHG